MDTLTIEPTYRVVLGDVKRFRIMVVGVGGTGSTLALFLAGLAFHAQQKGIQVEITLVDNDIIEAQNVGRQHFAASSALIGNVPKCVDLAARLNAAYGLGLTAWPVKYEAGLARDWFHHGHNGDAQAHLMIGCVDNYLGRQEIAKTVTAFDGRIWALDSGNEQNSGQILIGNLTDTSQIKLDKLGLCSGLPSPYVQEPDLLEPDPQAQNHSCAEMALAETQSLMVNRMAATIAAQYVAAFVLQRQITQMRTAFNLQPLIAHSQSITQTVLRLYL